MATFDDILHDAQPALQYGRSAVIGDQATEGRNWFWTFEIVDALDDPINLDTLGVTAECVVYADHGGAVLIEPTVDIDGSVITITATDDETTGLAGTSRPPLRCPWRLTLTETATGRSADVWGVHDSMLLIRGDD